MNSSGLAEPLVQVRSRDEDANPIAAEHIEAKSACIAGHREHRDENVLPKTARGTGCLVRFAASHESVPL